MREEQVLPGTGRWRAGGATEGPGAFLKRHVCERAAGPSTTACGGGPPPRSGEELDAIIARARSCIGARFRPHGRDPAHGLDCVGVAAIAFGREVAGDYPLRGGDAARVVAAIAATGLQAVDDPRAGDLVMLAGGPAQLHLAVLTGQGFVHADVGLRRVVETPGRPGDIIGIWRES